jgi:hypothetical protein
MAAAAMGSALGFFAPLPEAPHREPMHDTDARTGDVTPVIPQVPVSERAQVPHPGPTGPQIIVPGFNGMPGVVAPLLHKVPPGLEIKRPSIDVVDANKVARTELMRRFQAPITQEHGTYVLLSVLRNYLGSSELTDSERRATDWFTHAVARYINENPSERINVLTSVPMKKGVIASTIPKKVGNQFVELQFGNMLQRKDFWEWFDDFYGKRKSTTLSRPGLSDAIDTLTARLKTDFSITP